MTKQEKPKMFLDQKDINQPKSKIIAIHGNHVNSFTKTDHLGLIFCIFEETSSV